MDYVVLIDLEDVEQVITKRWHITEKGYVKSTDGFSLHRFVMNIEKTKGLYAKDKPVVHHVNHSPLDNRKSNLQIMTWEDHVKLHSIEGEGRVRKVEKEVEELVLKLKEVLMENDIDLNSPTLAKAMKHISKYGFEDEKVGAQCVGYAVNRELHSKDATYHDFTRRKGGRGSGNIVSKVQEQ